MAVASRRKANSFDVGGGDETLREVLSAGKTNLTYKNGEFIHDESSLIEEEPLDIISNEQVVSYEAVHERGVEYVIEHEDAAVRREYKKKSRRLTRRKLFETILSIGLVILVGFFVMLLLYPQTELSELARDNSNLKDQINVAKREIVNAEEKSNGIADMDTIRAQAMALGMQDPNQNQVINLPLPNTDSLQTKINYNTDGVTEEVFNNSKDALADYYAAHPDK
ncbi:MAG: hypothetical protein K5665_11905 [Saccharofermentans sp.]|nr:hypothetical protein [Saccharofermentans sp.]